MEDAVIKEFVPRYDGVLLEGEEKYLKLENLLYGFEHPNLMDCKIGCRYVAWSGCRCWMIVLI